MKRILMLCLFLTVLITCVSCAQPAQTTEAPSETTPTVAITTTEPAYYFQTVDNFVELNSDFRGPSHIFRHDEKSQMDYEIPSIGVTATIPPSVVIDGETYELNVSSRKVIGRNVRYKIKNVSATVGTVDPYVSFDGINGNLTGFSGFEVRPLTSEEKQLDPVTLAQALVSQYLPHISMEGYQSFQNTITEKQYDSAFLGTVSFRKYINGYETEQMIHVSFHQGTLRGVYAQNVYNTEDLDLSALDRIDKEDTEKIIDSLIEYVRNGHKIVEPELWSKMIVLMPDGRYAIQYDIIIRLDDPEFPWEDRISACIYLDDSKAE